MFSSKAQRYPRGWREMTFDFKLFFAYHICMMILFALGGILTVVIEITIALPLVIIFLILSLAHRRKLKWHWPGVKFGNIFGAIMTIILGAVFIYAGYPLCSPANPRLLPFYMGALGIIIFNTLFNLKIVYLAEKEFLGNCGDFEGAPQVETSVGPSWKKAVKIFYSILFVIVWLEFMLFFHKFSVAFHKGSPEPTATQTEQLVNHGKISYITPEEKKIIDTLEGFMLIGIPLVLLLGFFLQFVVGVEIIPNLKTVSQRKDRLKQGGAPTIKG